MYNFLNYCLYHNLISIKAHDTKTKQNYVVKKIIC